MTAPRTESRTANRRVGDELGEIVRGAVPIENEESQRANGEDDPAPPRPHVARRCRLAAEPAPFTAQFWLTTGTEGHGSGVTFGPGTTS